MGLRTSLVASVEGATLYITHQEARPLIGWQGRQGEKEGEGLRRVEARR